MPGQGYIQIGIDQITGDGDITGSGTAGYIPVFTSTYAIGNSVIQQGTGNALSFAPTASTSAGVTPFTFTTPINTGQAGDSEITGVFFNSGSRQWVSANITTQREFYVSGSTYSSVAVGTTIGNAYTFYTEAPTGSGVTISNPMAAGFSGNISASKAYLGGLTTAPTALLHLAAGTATAGTGPLKFTTGTNLTTPEAGTMEFSSSVLYFTPSATRMQVSLIDGGGSLTAGRVVYVATGGFLTDSANFTFSGIRLSPNYITLAAGTATAGTAPIVFTSGTNLTVAVAGSMEWDGTDLFLTSSTPTRNLIAQVSGSSQLLLSGVPYVTTNGRLVTNAALTFSGTRLSPNYITLAAGTATAGTSPLKFTTGTNLSVVEAGTMEFSSSVLYFTPAATRYNVALNNGVLTTNAIPYSNGAGVFLSNGAFLFNGVAFSNTQTLSATDPTGTTFTYTSAAAAANYLGMNVSLGAGYTGTAVTRGCNIANSAAGTGADLKLATGNSNILGNAGIVGFTTATTTGYNVTVYAETFGGNIGVGVIGKSVTAKNSATNIGVIGVANNTGSSPILIGGYFQLAGSDTPTFTGASAALVADNGATTSPIQLWRDNGAIIASMIDGGFLFIGGTTTPTARLHLAAGTATATTGPLKFTSGTNLTTAEAGCMEYNGTNLFFTRTGTTRQTVLTANVVTTESVVSDTTITVNVAGTDYKLLARA